MQLNCATGKILYSQDSIGNNWEQTKKYAREQEGKMWLLDSLINNEEVLVMDMNLEVGDQFEINQGFHTLYVISTKIINDFGGEMRRVVELSCNPDEAPYITWIEGVGPALGVFEAALGYCYPDFGYNSLTCFYSNDVLLWESETSASCWAKPIPPVSYSELDPRSTWYSTTWLEVFGGEECELGINTINVSSNTIFNQQWVQILGVTDNGVYWEESEVPFYKKDNKMYFYEDGQWKLLYDFNALVGDTVTYYISAKAKYYQLYGVYPDTIHTGPYQLLIRSIDTVYSEYNQPLKRFQTESINGFSHGHFMGEIIEKAGSTYKIFGNYGFISLPECLNGPRLRCFEEFPTLLYKFVPEACDSISSIYDLHISGISIYPNPGNEQLVINKDEHSGLKFNVHTVTGHQISTGEILPSQQGQINTAAWNSGMYIISIHDKEGKRFTSKWVKL